MFPLLFIIGGLFALGLAIFVHGLIAAPEGVEDAEGFRIVRAAGERMDEANARREQTPPPASGEHARA